MIIKALPFTKKVGIAFAVVFAPAGGTVYSQGKGMKYIRVT